MARQKLTNTLINSTKCPPDKTHIYVWDSVVRGFGICVTRADKKTYVLRYKYCSKDRIRNMYDCVGHLLEEARDNAVYKKKLLHEGFDPFDAERKLSKNPTFYELCCEYYDYLINVKKIKGTHYQTDINFLKKDRLGNMRVDKIDVSDADMMLQSRASTPRQADKQRGFYKCAYKYAQKKRYVAMGVNPWEYTDRYNPEPTQPRITEEEAGKIVDYLRKAEKGIIRDRRGHKLSPYWTNFVWLLFFTGCRPKELLTLKWKYIHLGDDPHISFPDTKTGHKHLPLSIHAVTIIQKIQPVKGNPYVIVGNNPKSHMINYRKQYDLMRERLGIKAPAYALRRFFATTGREALKKIASNEAEKEMSIERVSNVIGHKDKKMTALYAGEDPEKMTRASQDMQVIANELNRIAYKTAAN